MNLGRGTEAAGEARRALELARELGYPAGEARALHVLGGAAGYAGDPQAGVAWLRQAQQIDPAGLPGQLIRRCAIGLANLLCEVGGFAEALQQCARGLASAREAGDLRDQADCLELLTRLDLQAGQFHEAAAHMREGIGIAVRIGLDFMLVDCLDLCGHLCSRTHRHADALTAWTAHAALLEASELFDPPDEVERRQEPLRAARQALGPDRARAAEERGATMGLATAAEYALLLTSPQQQPADAPGLPRLSARERELVTLVAQGCTDAQIAAQLFISVRTVRSHLDRIRDKSGCRRRADLTRLALQAALVLVGPADAAVWVVLPRPVSRPKGVTGPLPSRRAAGEPVNRPREIPARSGLTGSDHVHTRLDGASGRRRTGHDGHTCERDERDASAVHERARQQPRRELLLHLRRAARPADGA